MDPIESFIRSNKKFSLHALINAHSRLSVLQLSKGGFVFEDVMQSLVMSGHELSVGELNAHAALVYEGVLVSHPGQKNLQMNREVIANDANFIKHILNTIYQRCNGVEFAAVEEFNMEAFMFLKGNYHKNTPSSENETRNNFIQQAPSQGFLLQQTFQHNSKRFTPSGDGTMKKFAPRNNLEADQIMDGDYRSPLSRIEFEKSEPIVRLLAQVRKVGMDILFPQSTHDKILACIFVAIRSATTPAHRELIDMVMAVKDSNHVSQLDSVSKTKVRGVLALLKHGELLVTQGSEGEPVRLYLAYGINSFKELRERHDSFLNRYMMEHHLFIPAILRSELVWQVDDDMRIQRIEAMNKLVSQLQLFFQGYQSKAAEYDEGNVGGIFSNGPSSNVIGKSLVSLGMDDSKVGFSLPGAGLGIPSESYLINNKSNRVTSGLQQDDAASGGRFDPLSSVAVPSGDQTMGSNLSDNDSTDWVNIGRQAAVQTKKGSHSNPPSNAQYFGSTFQNKSSDFMSNTHGAARNYTQQTLPHSFSQSRGLSTSLQQPFLNQSNYRPSANSEQRFSNLPSQYQQSGSNNQSKYATFSPLNQSNTTGNSVSDSFVYGNGRGMGASSSNGNSGAAVRGLGGGGTANPFTLYGGATGNLTTFGTTNTSSDRWSQQSYYRDDFLPAQSKSSTLVNDLNRSGNKNALSLGLASHEDVVFDTEKMMQTLPSHSSFMNSNSNFEYGNSAAFERNGLHNPKISFSYSDLPVQNDDYPSSIREINDTLVVSEPIAENSSLSNVVSNNETVDISVGMLSNCDIDQVGNDSMH